MQIVFPSKRSKLCVTLGERTLVKVRFNEAAEKIKEDVKLHAKVEFDSFRKVANDPSNFFRAVIINIFEHLIAMPPKEKIDWLSLSTLKEQLRAQLNGGKRLLYSSTEVIEDMLEVVKLVIC